MLALSSNTFSLVVDRKERKDTMTLGPKPHQVVRKEPGKMTVIVAVRYDHGVIMAADSRVSGGYMDADGHDKTREFPTANGIAVLGYAGTIAHVEAAVHTIEQSMNKADSPYAAKTVCEKGIDAARVAGDVEHTRLRTEAREDPVRQTQG